MVQNTVILPSLTIVAQANPALDLIFGRCLMPDRDRAVGMLEETRSGCGDGKRDAIASFFKPLLNADKHR